MGPVPLGGSWKGRRGSHTLGSPLTSGEISRDRKETSEAQRRVQQPVCGRQKRERPTDLHRPVRATALNAPVWDAHLLVWAGVGAGTRDLEDRHGERVDVGCAETAWRSVVQPQLGVFTWEAQACHRSKVPLLSGVQSEGWGCHYSLFLYALAPASVGSEGVHPSHHLSWLHATRCLAASAGPGSRHQQVAHMQTWSWN